MNSIKQHQPKPLSIMIIDDCQSERRLLRHKLHKFGHQVTEMKCGNDALAHLIEKNLKGYDLLLLDINMPGLSGLETAKQIRQLESTLNENWLPIIFLSGCSTPSDIALGIQFGGDDYLTKPLESTILNAKIAAIQRIANIHQQLQHQSSTDELTQLANRRHFFTTLESEMSRARRQDSPLAVAYLDLDYFKQVNDRYGHDVGDTVLRSIAEVLQQQLRSEDSVARLGGEEFAICLPAATLAQSIEACTRYRTLVEELAISHGPHTLNITVSIGLALYQPKHDTIDSLLKRADQALYLAKENGRNCIEVMPTEEMSLKQKG